MENTKTTKQERKMEPKKKLDNVIKFPLATEKSIRLMESENKLMFAVDSRAKKSDIKIAVQEMFKVKVEKVHTFIRGNQKRAYIKFSKETPAIDVATKLGII